MDPLITRSTPDGLWQYVPAAVTAWDEQVIERLQEIAPSSPLFWVNFRWLTETTAGVLCQILLIFGLYLLKNRATLKIWSQGDLSRRAKLAALVLLLMAASNELSTWIKSSVGRLKRHVTFYNPYYEPAYSMPSSHAFNTAFFWVLLYFLVGESKRRKHWMLLTLTLVLVLFIGFSRVLFREHYPSDVLTGWVLGASFGYVAGRILTRMGWSF